MRTWFLLWGVVLIAGCSRGGGEESRRIVLSHLSSEDALALVLPHATAETSVSVSKDVPAIVISGSVEEVDQLSEIIRRFDRPSANVELRFQVIEANGFTNTDSAVADVESALRNLFRFRGYRLVGESLVVSQAPGTVGQRIGGESGRMPFQIVARLTRVIQSDSAAAVALEVRLEEAGDMLLGTTLTVPSGQTVVVGTARSSRDGNTLILVVRPRIE